MALSEVTVGAAALPLMILVALANVRRVPRAVDDDDEEDAREASAMSPTIRLVRLPARRGRASRLVLLLGMSGLAPIGEPSSPPERTVGDWLNRVALPERHLTNVVSAVNFDYRGLDTLGEEYILFAAVAGVALLLRERRGESERDRPEGEPRARPAAIAARPCAGRAAG